MKKIIILLIILSFPLIVFAKSNVEITNITLLEEQTIDVEEIEPVKFKDLKLNFNLRFNALNGKAIYKLTVKNNTDKDYAIDDASTFNEGEFIRYDYSIDETSKILKANESTSIYIIITYFKELNEEQLINGKYTEKDSVAIELLNNSVIDNPSMRFTLNPNTSTSDIITIVIVLALMSLLLILVIKSNRKGKLFILILLSLIPVIAFALEKLSIEIETYVEINKAIETKIFYIAGYTDEYVDFMVDEESKKEYHFIEGMNFAEWLNSEYNTDNLSFTSGAGFCDLGDTFLAENIKALDNLTEPQLTHEAVIIEGNTYIKGTGLQCSTE